MTDQQRRLIAASALPSVGRRRLQALFEAGTVTGIPDGRGRGTVLLGTGGPLGRAVAAFAHALLWRGKIVDSRQGRLQNLLGPSGVPAVAAAVYQGPSWHDGRPCIVLDYSRTSWVARMVRDEIREVAPGLFLGLVFLGRVHVLDFSLDFTR
jgi:hypothetical protein